MAFRVIKKKKRQAAPSASDILDLDTGTENESAVNEDLDDEGESSSSTVPSYMKPQKKNVVATQPWVFRMMKSIWNWTRHFGT